MCVWTCVHACEIDREWVTVPDNVIRGTFNGSTADIVIYMALSKEKK